MRESKTPKWLGFTAWDTDHSGLRNGSELSGGRIGLAGIGIDTDVLGLRGQQGTQKEREPAVIGERGCPLEGSAVLVREVFISTARQDAMVRGKYREQQPTLFG